MTGIKSQYQRQVAPQMQQVMQPVIQQVKQGTTKKSQRYQAINKGLDALTGALVQQSHKENTEKQQAQQQLDQIETASTLKKSAISADQWLNNPANIGENAETSYKTYLQQNPIPTVSQDLTQQGLVGAQHRANFEQIYQQKKVDHDKTERNTKVYEHGVELLDTLRSEGTPMDYTSYSTYMQNQEMTESEQADNLLALGKTDAGAWKYIVDIGLGTRKQQVEAKAHYSAYEKGSKQKALTIDQRVYLDHLVTTGDIEALEAFRSSGVPLTSAQEFNYLKSTHEQYNKNLADTAVINAIHQGIDPANAMFYIPTEQLSVEIEGRGTAVGKVDLKDYMDKEHLAELVDKAAATADSKGLMKLRASSMGIPAEIKQINRGLKGLVDEKGNLSASAMSLYQTLKQYQSVRGGITGVTTLFKDDPETQNAITLMLSRLESGEEAQRVLRDVGTKLRNGNITGQIPNSTWSNNYGSKSYLKKRDELPLSQRFSADTLAKTFGRMGMDKPEAYKRAVAQMDKSNGEITAWVGRSYKLTGGRVFAQELTQLVDSPDYALRSANSHDVLDWYVKEVVNLLPENTQESYEEFYGSKVTHENVELIVNEGLMRVVTQWGEVIPVSPISSVHLMVEYLEAHPDQKIPGGVK